jgi:hypothetical protein
VPNLSDLVGACARLGCQDDPGHIDVEQPTRIRCRTDPCVDQQLKLANSSGECCQQVQVIPRLLKGIQISHVDLITPESRVKFLQQDERIRARRQTAVHWPVSFAVAALRVNRDPSPDVEHGN